MKRSGSRVPIIVKLPKPVCAFIRAFDSGCYPELVIDFRRPPASAWGGLPATGDGKKGQEPVPPICAPKPKTGRDGAGRDGER